MSRHLARPISSAMRSTHGAPSRANMSSMRSMPKPKTRFDPSLNDTVSGNSFHRHPRPSSDMHSTPSKPSYRDHPHSFRYSAPPPPPPGPPAASTIQSAPDWSDIQTMLEQQHRDFPPPPPPSDPSMYSSTRTQYSAPPPPPPPPPPPSNPSVHFSIGTQYPAPPPPPPPVQSSVYSTQEPNSQFGEFTPHPPPPPRPSHSSLHSSAGPFTTPFSAPAHPPPPPPDYEAQSAARDFDSSFGTGRLGVGRVLTAADEEAISNTASGYEFVNDLYNKETKANRRLKLALGSTLSALSAKDIELEGVRAQLESLQSSVNSRSAEDSRAYARKFANSETTYVMPRGTTVWEDFTNGDWRKAQ